MPDPIESHHRCGHRTGHDSLQTLARPEKTYRGHHEADGNCVVEVVEELVSLSADVSAGSVRPLPLALEVWAHSPTGFSWGYCGSGPAQLALALLVDALGDAELAQQQHQSFKRAYVAKWRSSWSITASEIRAFVAREREGACAQVDASAVEEALPVSTPRVARFELGEVCVTAKVAMQIPPEEVSAALARHGRGDWGDLEEIDRAQNERFLQEGGMLLSGFRTNNGVKFWVLTEWDRTRTTVLLTEDY